MLHRSTTTAALLAGSLILAGCSTIVPRERFNPAGQTFQVVAAGGATSRMQFRPNGQVVAAVGQRSITGEWTVQDDGLCFRWGSAPVECWPVSGQFQRGRTVTITSTRGNVVQVTRQ